jgi:hypothetical protein
MNPNLLNFDTFFRIEDNSKAYIFQVFCFKSFYKANTHDLIIETSNFIFSF